jgi:hypothetical protein
MKKVLNVHVNAYIVSVVEQIVCVRSLVHFIAEPVKNGDVSFVFKWNPIVAMFAFQGKNKKKKLKFIFFNESQVF